jgi:hypothetical protein
VQHAKDQAGKEKGHLAKWGRAAEHSKSALPGLFILEFSLAQALKQGLQWWTKGAAKLPSSHQQGCLNPHSKNTHLHTFTFYLVTAAAQALQQKPWLLLLCTRRALMGPAPTSRCCLWSR